MIKRLRYIIDWILWRTEEPLPDDYYGEGSMWQYRRDHTKWLLAKPAKPGKGTIHVN